jgi:hypothetical protein
MVRRNGRHGAAGDRDAGRLLHGRLLTHVAELVVASAPSS